MSDTNYIGGIVKILEVPKQKFLNNTTAVTELESSTSPKYYDRTSNLLG
jgi:hypothetical protein